MQGDTPRCFAPCGSQDLRLFEYETSKGLKKEPQNGCLVGADSNGRIRPGQKRTGFVRLDRREEPVADGRNRSRNYPAGLEAEPVEEAVPAHVGVRPDIHHFEPQGQQVDITVIDTGSLSELLAVLHITHGESARNLRQGAPRITKWQHLPPARSFRSR